MPKTPYRAKSRQNTRRGRAFRDSHARVLIVCEGSKTERNYFLILRPNTDWVTVLLQWLDWVRHLCRW